MARFPRPYCATEPVRTVPFFNLYDDIQITQLGAFTAARHLWALNIWTGLRQVGECDGVPVRRDPLRREAHGTGRPAEPRVAEHPRRRLLDTPQVTPNDT